MSYAITKWTLLNRAIKPSALMGSAYSRESLKFLNFIFTFQGFGLLFFDLYFRDFNIFTLLIFFYSFLQLINFKKLIYSIRKKFYESKNKKSKNENISKMYSSGADSKSIADFDSSPLFKFSASSVNLNNNRALKLLNSLDTNFKTFNRYFVNDYDRLNPITKIPALQKYTAEIKMSSQNSKLIQFTKNNILNGMMSTIMTTKPTGNNRNLIGFMNPNTEPVDKSQGGPSNDNNLEFSNVKPKKIQSIYELNKSNILT